MVNNSTQGLVELISTLEANGCLREQIVEEFDSLPSDEFRDRYLATFQGILGGKERDPVKRVTGVRGALFEITRINRVKRQRLEELLPDFDTQYPKGILVDEYQGFRDAPAEFTADENLPSNVPERVGAKLEKFYTYSTDSNKWVLNEGVGLNKVRSIFQDPSMIPFLQEMYANGATELKKKSPISLDVSIQRDKPYVYDTKSYPRRIYGQSPNHINQLLKYQKAIETGLVEGATIEVDGRVDPGFLKWAAGNYVDGFGEIPDVEILYSLALPGGKEYRFVLKSARNSGLNFQNENHLSDDDKQIVKGVQKAILDGSILSIVSELDPANFSGIEPAHVQNPSQISDVNEFEHYETLRLQSVWDRLKDKYDQFLINKSNSVSAYSPLANPENVERIIRNYQAYLRQNPEVAKFKQSYILKDEQIPDVVEKTMSLVEMIKVYETTRQSRESESQPVLVRTEKGYVGLEEGVALDVEHIIIDAIQEMNKKSGKVGRSYDDLSRFKTVDELEDYLETVESRRYIEAKTYDPVNDKVSTVKPSRGGDKAILELERKLLAENLQRLEVEVSEKNGLGNRKNIQAYKSAIQGLESEKSEKLKKANQEAKQTRDYGAVREISETYNTRIFGLKQELEQTYISVIGKNRSDELRVRITNVIDQDIVKFIYAVNADESVVVDEEIVRGEITGRASHSELAQGRNVYGAGELIYSKHNHNFDSFREWSDWRSKKEDSPTWTLTEINNGSGHYRPSSETLTYVKNVLDQNYHVDVSKAKLVNTLVRGAQLRDMDIF